MTAGGIPKYGLRAPSARGPKRAPPDSAWGGVLSHLGGWAHGAESRPFKAYCKLPSGPNERETHR